MIAEQPEADKLHRYLLGDLPEDEGDALEAAYLARDDVFHRLLAAEEQLIDAYVAGSLSDADRRRFEEHFLTSPARRERVAFARALARLPAEPAPSGSDVVAAGRPGARRSAAPPALVASLAAALVLALAGSAWLVVRVRGLGAELARAEAEREAAVEQGRRPDPRAAELEKRLEALLRETTQTLVPSMGRVVVAILSPGVQRAGTRPSVRVPPDADWVNLRLFLEDDSHPRYAASLQTPEGETLASVKDLRSMPASNGHTLEFVVPATTLADGTYVVEVQGIPRRGAPEVVASYHLHVVRPSPAGR